MAESSPDAANPKDTNEDDGPGWMPAIMAATLLLSIFGFIACSFSTWFLFQKRTEIAVRTLRGSLLPQLEQSLMDPDTKSEVIEEIEGLAADMERGKYENWQSAAIMQRLQRAPILQWGDLQAIEAFCVRTGQFDDQTQKQLSRLKWAVELDQVTSFDFNDVLEPAHQSDASSVTGRSLIQPLNQASVDQVIEKARLLADRAEIPDEVFEEVRIGAIVRREIAKGATED